MTRYHGEHPPHSTCLDVGAMHQQPGSEWVCGAECPMPGDPEPRVTTSPTLGEIVAELPVGVWHNLPEHGCRIRHYENPIRVDVMPVPVIRVARAEFATERFWAERVDPVARAHGIDTNGRDYGLRIDSRNPAQQLLLDDEGRLVLVVHVDEEAEA